MNVALSAAAALLGLGLGEAGWGLSTFDSPIYWPGWTHAQFLCAGAAVALLWSWGQAIGWKLAFHWDLAWGLRLGLAGLLPAPLGFAWRILGRVRLPPPHDFSARNIELLIAALGLWAVFSAIWLGVAGLFAGRSLDRFPAKSLALRLGAVSLLVYLLSGAWAGQFNSTGDAPHYVLMSHSMLHDQDLDLANNYDKGHWKLFFDRANLERQLPNQASGRQMPEHKVGLSLLMLPGYAYFGMSGARLMLGLMAAAGASVLFLLLMNLGYGPRLALGGWLIFSFSAPWLNHAQLALPELAGGFLLLLVLASWRSLLPRALGWLCIAGFFWFSVRFYPLALFLACMQAWRERAKPLFWMPLALAALSLALALWQNASMHGDASPAVTYTQRNLSLATLIQPLKSLRYISGVLIDQEYGWFPYVPVFYLAFFGLASLWKRERDLFWVTLLPALAYSGPILNFPWWFSGMAPNRYFICLTPLFTLWTIEAWKAWGTRLSFLTLAAFSLLWAAFLTLLPWYCWGRQNNQNMVLETLEKFSHVELTRWFPTFFENPEFPSRAVPPLSWIWVACLGLALLWWKKRLGAPRPAPGR